MLGFNLQCVKVCLQRALKSFVCSVLEFCLQCVGVLFAACNSFACSVHVFFLQFLFCLQCARDNFFDVLFMFARNFFSLQCFLFVKAVSPVGHRRRRGTTVSTLPKIYN